MKPPPVQTSPRRNWLLWALGAVFTCVAGGCLMGSLLLAGAFVARGPAPTVDGPEDPKLREGLRGTLILDKAWEIETREIPEGKVTTEKLDGEWRVHAIGGLAPDGRGWRIENDMMGERHRLGLASAEGRAEWLFTRAGDALWGEGKSMPIGETVALTPNGDRVAVLADLTNTQLSYPVAYVPVGPIEVWDVAARRRRRFEVDAIDAGLSWFPDGRRLAFAKAGAPNDFTPVTGFAVDFFGGSSVVGVYVLDTATGDVRPLHVGWNPVVSMNGQRVALTDNSGGRRIVDVGTRLAIPLEIPGLTSVVAMLDDDRIVFRGYPTKGGNGGYTRNNSPLVGPKPLLAVKVGSLRTGGFATLAEGIDPRNGVSFTPHRR